MPRKYYSARTGKATPAEINFDVLKRLIVAVYQELKTKGFFTEAFGFSCTDTGFNPGTAGDDVELYVFRHLRNESLWPISKVIDYYTEETLFDMIEFLFDHVSAPTSSYYHPWNNCGTHFTSFDKEQGKKQFREEINAVLAEYKNINNDRFELSEHGEIFKRPDEGLEVLLEAQLPADVTEEVRANVSDAITIFRRHHSSLVDRKNAVLMLSGVLESLRGDLKKVVTTKDEDDLFNIANNFGIRHQNDKQKTDYEQSIWLGWMFNYYLATIHAVTRRIEYAKKDGQL